ncbi:MAG TPA: di-heme oxidoredictase family protein [Terriglobia bacterium]|nr:di-heme oxidoredictase family protein [Terriglobia bacterium]
MYRRIAFFAAATVLLSTVFFAQSFSVVDPGVRGNGAGAGGPIYGLTAHQTAFFSAGEDAFREVDTVASGLGPRFNLNSCAGCHAQPAVGGSSPAQNPQVVGGVAPAYQINNLVNLGLISTQGPVREVRFKSDGGVHDLFVTAGMSGTATGCTIVQPNFEAHLKDIIFRTPTPTFGAGLIEGIPDRRLIANEMRSKPYGITGHVNRNGNDGTVTRFGWKAQNKSLLLFAGEAYNVEQGISNDLFPQQRGEGGSEDPNACYTTPDPNDTTNFDAPSRSDVLPDIDHFANFMRFLDQPEPACTVKVNCPESVDSGFGLFHQIGCAVCHTPSMRTDSSPVAALSSKQANLFSDLLVHDMGELGDGISQGAAGPNEFRTAPLWGVGQRIFFLHDGRTTNLLRAIEEHADDGRDYGSEAYQVIRNFNSLSSTQQQKIINFLRSL